MGELLVGVSCRYGLSAWKEGLGEGEALKGSL